MKAIVTKHYQDSRAKGGRKKDHAPSDQILMTLEYYREYRAYLSSLKRVKLTTLNSSKKAKNPKEHPANSGTKTS